MARKESQDPVTPEDWQNAVDVADAYLRIDSAVKYGLVTFGETVDVERCEELLRQGAERGIVPRPDTVEQVVAEIAARSSSQGSANA